MRALVVVVLVLSWPAPARSQVLGHPASAHQEQAFAAMEAGDHATASREFYEAFWLTRNLNLLRGAAQEAEVAGLGRDAATYYYLYINLARLPANEAETLRRKVTQQHWSTGPTSTGPPRASDRNPAPAPPRAPTPGPPPAPPTPPAPTPPSTVAASTAGTAGSGGRGPFVEPFPINDLKPVPPTLPAPAPPPATIRPVSNLRVRTDEEPETRVKTVSYAGEILISEGLSLASLLVGIEAESSELVSLGVLGMIFGAPIVHSVNGKGGGAWFGSWGLRLLGMLLVGASSESVGGVVAGYMLGAGFDAFVIARKDVVVQTDASVAVLPMAGGRGLSVAWWF